MVYTDPYIYDPAKQRAELRVTIIGSLALHVLLVGGMLAFAGSRLFESEQPIEPQKVYEVSLVAAVPKEIPKALPNKVTSAPPPPPAEDIVPLEQPEEPEPEPKEEPKKEPEPKEDLSKTLDRLASLRNRLKSQPQSTPVPEAAEGQQNRPNEAEEASAGTRSDAVAYKADSPEGRYLGSIRAAVVNAWIVNQRLKKEQPDLKVVIQLTIGGDGRLVLPSAADEAIVASSGNVSFDQSALRAVRMVASQERFPSPPAPLKGEIANLGFTAGDSR